MVWKKCEEEIVEGFMTKLKKIDNLEVEYEYSRIEVPGALTRFQRTTISSLLCNYEWLITFFKPESEMESVFMQIDREKIQILREAFNHLNR